eukprot:1387999-Amphidinium_carterae.1
MHLLRSTGELVVRHRNKANTIVTTVKNCNYDTYGNRDWSGWVGRLTTSMARCGSIADALCSSAPFPPSEAALNCSVSLKSNKRPCLRMVCVTNHRPSRVGRSRLLTLSGTAPELVPSTAAPRWRDSCQ